MISRPVGVTNGVVGGNLVGAGGTIGIAVAPMSLHRYRSTRRGTTEITIRLPRSR